MSEEFEINREQMYERLDELLEDCLEDNWDGYGSYALESKSIKNARTIIDEVPDDVLAFWNLFPSPNGTLSFDAKDRAICGMSIGNDSYSYAAAMNDKLDDAVLYEGKFVAEEAVQSMIMLTEKYLKTAQ